MCTHGEHTCIIQWQNFVEEKLVKLSAICQPKLVVTIYHLLADQFIHPPFFTKIFIHPFLPYIIAINFSHCKAHKTNVTCLSLYINIHQIFLMMNQDSRISLSANCLCSNNSVSHITDNRISWDSLAL